MSIFPAIIALVVFNAALVFVLGRYNMRRQRLEARYYENRRSGPSWRR